MQTFNLDLSAKRVIPLMYAKQRDVGSKICVVLKDNGNEYVVPDGVTWSVWYSGASGEGNYDKIDDRDAVVVDGSTATVELIYQMLDNPGPGEMCLVMNGAGGTQLGLWNIPYFVEAIPGADSKAALQYYQAFLQAQGKAEGAAAKSEAAAGRAEGAAAQMEAGLKHIETQVLAASGAARNAAASEQNAKADADRAAEAAKEAADKKPKDVIVTATFEDAQLDGATGLLVSNGTSDLTALEIATAIGKGATVKLIDNNYTVYEYSGYLPNPSTNTASFSAEIATAEGIKVYSVNIDNQLYARRVETLINCGAEDAVTYAPQDLTPEQRAQARENMGAVSETEVEKIVSDAVKSITNAEEVAY